jgi:selenocysteine-specific elongation factor
MIGAVKHLVVGTAGHIDHGKSTLVEALTGIDPDRLQEEKARGITIDLGFAPYRHGDTQLAFVDVPGHERFVRNMLAGASGIDCVLLVIAADESVMPQTREHFDICRLLGVGGGMVALTKSDLVDEETLELVRLETRELIAGSFLDGAPLVPVSARTGAGLDNMQRELAALADGVAGRVDSGIPRLPVDRAFSVKGFGTVVTGTQASGVIEGEGELALMPAGRRVKVRGLQVHGNPLSRSRAGQRVAVNLAAIGVDDLQRGDTLTTQDGLCASRRFDGRVTLLDGARPLKYGARVRFHQGTSEVMARLAIGAARSTAGKANGGAAAEEAPEFPGVLEPGGSAFGRLHLERPVALTRGDRFVLRAYSPMMTIGGGVVLDPAPPSGRLRSLAGFERLRRLDALDDDAEAVLTMVGEAAGAGVTFGALAPRVGRTAVEVRRVAAPLVERGALISMGERLVAAATVEAAREALLTIAGAYHRAHPLEPGLPREEARERLARQAGRALFEHVAQALVAAGRLAVGRHLVLSTHRIVLTDEETRVKDELARMFLREALSPPDPGVWARERGVDEALADRMLKLLVRDGTVERLDTLLFHRDVLGRLREDVAGLSAGAGEPVRIDVAWFKQRFGITRKFAIPLLEYLDRVRVTRRAGRERIVI